MLRRTRDFGRPCCTQLCNESRFASPLTLDVSRAVLRAVLAAAVNGEGIVVALLEELLMLRACNHVRATLSSRELS